jgi:hypothetical protein
MKKRHILYWERAQGTASTITHRGFTLAIWLCTQKRCYSRLLHSFIALGSNDLHCRVLLRPKVTVEVEEVPRSIVKEPRFEITQLFIVPCHSSHLFHRVTVLISHRIRLTTTLITMQVTMGK